MGRFAFSTAILAMISVTLCGTAQATPIAPVPPATARVANTTSVYYRHWHHRYWHHGGYPIAGFWNYYRTFGPGRGNSVESTR